MAHKGDFFAHKRKADAKAKRTSILDERITQIGMGLIIPSILNFLASSYCNTRVDHYQNTEQSEKNITKKAGMTTK